MKFNDITVDSESVLRSLANIGIQLLPSEETSGVKIVDENNDAIILPKGFNIMD